MTFDEFINKWSGKVCDFDHFYGGQCVDLYRQYVKEVLNFPQSPAVRGARDIWDNFPRDYYIRYSNTPLGVPQKGDIVIWGTGYGTYGHVGIYTGGNVMWFYSFDQNDPIGSKCHIQRHSYRGVLGWLRPKVLKLTDEQKEQEIRRILGEQISPTEHIKKIEAVIHA